MNNQYRTQIDIRPYTLSQLAALYDISNATMKKWLTPLSAMVGERRGRYYTITQVKIIFGTLGIPGHYRVQELSA